MSLSVVERRILDLAVEDSYALSEIVARVRDEYPELPPHEAKAHIRTVVQSLFRKGLLEVTRLESPEAAEPSLEAAPALAALDDDLNWVEAKHWRPHIRIVASPAGLEAFYEP